MLPISIGMDIVDSVWVEVEKPLSCLRVMSITVPLLPCCMPLKFAVRANLPCCMLPNRPPP